MKKDAILYGIIGLLAGSLLTIAIGAKATNNTMTGMMRMMGINFQNNDTDDKRFEMMGNIDKHFIEQMIPHHEDAITMAEIALEKATHQEIKNLANDINRMQSVEIDQMKVWYKEWFETDVPKDSAVMGMHGMMGTSNMHMGMMGNETDIERLKTVSDFDKAFIEEMIPHHQMAVMMANMLLNATQRPEMKQLAQDIIAAQTKEINEMRYWYNQWYK